MATSLKTLVIGTSLTEASDAVVRIGVAIAQATGASPWLIHVYPPPLGATGAGMDALWIESQVECLKERIEDQARRTGLSALDGFSPDQLRLVLGSPPREIVSLATRAQADLIVVGAAESHRLFVGSTADRVIRRSPCPVLAIRTEATFPPRRVEIPVDLSPISAHGLRQGMALLEQMGVSPAEAEALFILNPFEVGGSITFTSEQIHRFANEELHRFVAENTDESTRPGSTRVRTGYPREEILKTLEERGADLAVLGTHGLSGFERFMIGSVAAGVLQSARCNLLIVPPAADYPEAATKDDKKLSGADWTYVSDEDKLPVASSRS